MKLFLVCRLWNDPNIAPSGIGHFDNEQDALAFARLNRKNDPEHRFAVYRAVACTK